MIGRLIEMKFKEVSLCEKQRGYSADRTYGHYGESPEAQLSIVKDNNKVGAAATAAAAATSPAQQQHQ